MPSYCNGKQYVRDLKKRYERAEERAKDKHMEASLTEFPRANSMSAAASALPRAVRRRRISPEAGHALEILGHAIEYLTDEYIHAGGSFSPQDGAIEAVQLLMAANRQIYFACPEVPSLSKRCRALLRLRVA